MSPKNLVSRTSTTKDDGKGFSKGLLLDPSGISLSKDVSVPCRTRSSLTAQTRLSVINRVGSSWVERTPDP